EANRTPCFGLSRGWTTIGESRRSYVVPQGERTSVTLRRTRHEPGPRCFERNRHGPRRGWPECRPRRDATERRQGSCLDRLAIGPARPIAHPKRKGRLAPRTGFAASRDANRALDGNARELSTETKLREG